MVNKGRIQFGLGIIIFSGMALIITIFDPNNLRIMISGMLFGAGLCLVSLEYGTTLYNKFESKNKGTHLL